MKMRSEQKIIRSRVVRLSFDLTREELATIAAYLRQRLISDPVVESFVSAIRLAADQQLVNQVGRAKNHHGGAERERQDRGGDTEQEHG